MQSERTLVLPNHIFISLVVGLVTGLTPLAFFYNEFMRLAWTAPVTVVISMITTNIGISWITTSWSRIHLSWVWSFIWAALGGVLVAIIVTVSHDTAYCIKLLFDAVANINKACHPSNLLSPVILAQRIIIGFIVFGFPTSVCSVVLTRLWIHTQKKLPRVS